MSDDSTLDPGIRVELAPCSIGDCHRQATHLAGKMIPGGGMVCRIHYEELIRREDERFLSSVGTV